MSCVGYNDQFQVIRPNGCWLSWPSQVRQVGCIIDNYGCILQQKEETCCDNASKMFDLIVKSATPFYKSWTSH